MGNIEPLKIRFLGGVGEIGKNMTALEYGDDIIIIDAGLTFPTMDMPGIDLVIPDITYLINNKDKIKGLFLTHGHEDHIGGVPYLLREIPGIPVYGTSLTLSLVENKLKDMNIRGGILNSVKPRGVVNTRWFSIEFINVNHSIPGSVALAISTPVGVVLHTGDFKVDLTPISGEIIDLSRLSEIGDKGVRLLMCESTNVERDGNSMSESVVYASLDRLFSQHRTRRIIVATFASNVFRIQQILNLASKFRKKVVLFGRSMVNTIEAARKIKEISVPEGIIVEPEQMKDYQDKELVIISTGSQGEPMSALSRMANGEFSQVDIGPNDTIIISASPIPGNEKNIYGVVNNLYRKGAEVVYESLEKIHASGHAYKEELKIMHSIIKPRFFIPVHGEYRHLKKHIDLAKSLGMKESNMLLCENGDTVELYPKQMVKGEPIPTGSRLVDGLSIDENEAVVRDRKHLSEEGLIISIACVSAESGNILQDPDIIARGAGITDAMIEDMKAIVTQELLKWNVEEVGDSTETRRSIRKKLRDYIFNKTKKNPMIIPIITKL